MMSKNRIAKLLLALGIGVATVTSGVAVAGCNPESGGGTPSGSEQTQKYTVKFDLNGATGTAPDSKQVDEGGKVSKPDDPSWTGHTFDGWYTAATGGTKWNFDSSTVTEDVTLYAHWTDSQQGGDVTADGMLAVLTAENFTAFNEGDSGENDVPDVEYEVKADKKVVLNVPTGAGECYLLALPTDAYINEGQSTKTFSIKIGTETVTYSNTNNWGMPSEDLSEEPIDFSGITTIEVSATADVTIHIALAPKTIFDSEGPGGETEYENVTTTVDLSIPWKKFGNGTKTTEVYEYNNVLSFDAGVYFDSTSGITGNTCNNQKQKIFFNLQGRTNSIKFDAKGAGSGTLILYKEDGTEEKSFGTITTAQLNLTADGLVAGKYYLSSSDGALRIGNISYTQELEKSAPTSLKVTSAVTKFLVGTTFDNTNISTTLVYANEREDAITTGAIIDASAYNKDVPGTYQIKVSYTANYNEQSIPLEGTCTVYVYGVDSLKLSDHSVDAQRVTHPVQKLFKTGDTFNSDNLAVTGECSTPGVTEKENFVLPKANVSVTAPTMTAGKQTVTVTAYQKTASYEINVVDLSSAQKDKVIVDSTAANVTTNQSGVLVTKSVNDALQAFVLMGTPADTVKTIEMKAGTYTEKVEVNIPNVHIVAAEGVAANQIIIEYNAMNGIVDPSGTTSYSTDGSATFSVREGATGFYAKGITLQNWYNTNERYNEAKAITSNTQAVACLVQADKAVFEGVRFSSYHDTLYAQKGRQYYYQCYIEGRTDYIFGDSGVAYFDDCDIMSIGAGTEENNGGYVLATKGVAGMKYGFVFNNCDFTGDDQVRDHSVSIARGWEPNMTIAVLNSRISKAFSLEAYGQKTTYPDGAEYTKDLNDRYGKMNADPNPAQLFEYNNTGDGALTQDLINSAKDGVIENMCTVLTEEQAALYTKENIFAASNVSSLFKDEWAGSVEQAVVTIYKGTEEVAKIYDYVGSTLEQEQLTAAMSGKVPAGQQIKGYYTENGGAVEFELTTRLTATVSIYVEYENFVAQEETIEFKTWTQSTVTSGKVDAGTIIDKASTGKNLVTVKLLIQSDFKGSKMSGGNDPLATNHIQAGDKGDLLEFILEEGYTYKITMYCGAASSTTATTVTLNGSTQNTGAGQTDLKCEWTGLAAGTYKLSQGNKCRIGSITIVATPV